MLWNDLKSEKTVYHHAVWLLWGIVFKNIVKLLNDTTDTNDNDNDNDTENLMLILLCVLSHSLLIYRDIFWHNLTKIRR